MLADALRAEYIDAIEAKDGEKGLMAAEQSLPHLILLDILMPRMDGRAVFRAIRAHKDLQHVPVSFLTNLTIWGVFQKRLAEKKPTISLNRIGVLMRLYGM